MRRLFSSDSIFVRFFSVITNMMLVNILWLLCCIPIVTAGAATTAAYYVFYQNLTREDDAVLKPFFRAFRQNFKQATLLWIPLLLIGMVLGWDLMYLIGNHLGEFHVLWVAFFVCALLYCIVLSHGFAILARYDAPLKQVVRNCFLVFLMNFFRSVLTIALMILIPAVLVFMPQVVVPTLPAWFCLIFGLVFYMNAQLFLHSFKKSDAAERNEEA
ncbi:MAG: DUF624 domain-containing protein [Ruminococcaceae bacterium]|nr:DUF624 domain-containing protein [Oscillospiraceae bacterium]